MYTKNTIVYNITTVLMCAAKAAGKSYGISSVSKEKNTLAKSTLGVYELYHLLYSDQRPISKQQWRKINKAALHIVKSLVFTDLDKAWFNWSSNFTASD